MANITGRIYQVISYDDPNADGDEFSNSNDMIRLVNIILFSPSTRIVHFEKRATGCLDRSVMESRGIPSDAELMSTGEAYKEKKIVIPRPPINPETIRCKCGELCQIFTSHSTDNPNRDYARCSSRNCKFFQWCDTAHIVCHCDKPAVCLVSRKTSKFKGEPFFKCSKGKKSSCGYIETEKNVQRYLRGDWGESFMTVDTALKKLKRHLDGPSFDFPIDEKILSTLSSECS